jgi:dephospho-CoA kinase
MAAGNLNIRRIGIAGFMGAGKSTCVSIMSALFRTRQETVRIIDADALAKRLMQSDGALKIALTDLFGQDIVVDDSIDFSLLGREAFKSAETLQMLNRTVHPRLVQELKNMVFSLSGPFVLCDAALIPLWNVESWFDTLLWVRASFENRLDRLRQKTALSSAELSSRMQLQQELFAEPSEAPWTVVKNEGNVEDLEKRLFELFRQ